jgi:hypothetical protein
MGVADGETRLPLEPGESGTILLGKGSLELGADVSVRNTAGTDEMGE